MEFRKFYFRNGKGEQIPLNGENGIYASNPTGLGVDRSRTYADLGGGVFSVTYDASLPMQTPGFKLIFTRRHRQYEDYQNLIRWLAAAGDGLRLVYVPYGGTAYHRKVLIRKITKTDLTRVTGWSARARCRPSPPGTAPRSTPQPSRPGHWTSCASRCATAGSATRKATRPPTAWS